MIHRTQPGYWHDPAMCTWKMYDGRGQLVAVITDEAYARAGFSPRDLTLATS